MAGLAAEAGPFPGAAVMFGVQVRDQQAVVQGVEAVMNTVGAGLTSAAAKQGRPPASQIRKQDEPRPTWTMTLPPGTMLSEVEPTVVVGKTWLALSGRRDAANAIERDVGDAPATGPTRGSHGVTIIARCRLLARPR
jgi:hypothetical protein